MNPGHDVYWLNSDIVEELNKMRFLRPIYRDIRVPLRDITSNILKTLDAELTEDFKK